MPISITVNKNKKESFLNLQEQDIRELLLENYKFQSHEKSEDSENESESESEFESDNTSADREIDAILGHIAFSRNLQKLSFIKCSVDASHTFKLTQALVTNQTITHLDLWNIYVLSEERSSIIEALKLIISKPKLESISIGYKWLFAVEACLDLLFKHSTLTSINFAEVYICEELVVEIAKRISQPNTIRKLNFNCNNVQHFMFNHIIEALPFNETLTVLDLQFVLSVDMQLLANALRYNHTLSHLNLGNNGIQQDLKHLAEALHYNQTLEVLDLSLIFLLKWYDLSPDKRFEQSTIGYKALAKMLCYNQSLKKIDLSSNFMDDYHIKIILCGLKYNRTLEQLCLNNMKSFNCRSASNIFGKLKYMHNLKRLDLSYLADEEICTDLARGLVYNHSLEVVNIEQNSYFEKFLTILPPIQHHHYLKSVTINDHKGGWDLEYKNGRGNEVWTRAVKLMQGVADIIQHTKTIEHLEFSCYCDCKPLFDALQYNQSLRELIFLDDGFYILKVFEKDMRCKCSSIQYDQVNCIIPLSQVRDFKISRMDSRNGCLRCLIKSSLTAETMYYNSFLTQLEFKSQKKKSKFGPQIESWLTRNALLAKN